MNSSNPSDAGDYVLRITGTSISDSTIKADTQFNLVVFPGDCLPEVVSPVGTLDPIDYYIGVTSTLTLQPEWSSNVVSTYTCP